MTTRRLGTYAHTRRARGRFDKTRARRQCLRTTRRYNGIVVNYNNNAERSGGGNHLLLLVAPVSSSRPYGGRPAAFRWKYIHPRRARYCNNPAAALSRPHREQTGVPPIRTIFFHSCAAVIHMRVRATSYTVRVLRSSRVADTRVRYVFAFTRPQRGKTKQKHVIKTRLYRTTRVRRDTCLSRSLR